MVSLDHLVTVPQTLEGLVVSANRTNRGMNYVVVDDSGVNLENRRRWLAYEPDVSGNDRLQIGDRISFLPGPPRGKKRMGRAYEVKKLFREGNC